MEYANPTFFPLHHFERMLHTTDSLATSFILITACRDCSQVIVAHLWLSVAEKQLSKTTLRLASLGVPFNSSGAARCGDLKDCCRGRLVEGVLYPFNSSDAYSELFRQRIHSLLRGRYPAPEKRAGAKSKWKQPGWRPGFRELERSELGSIDIDQSLSLRAF
jgi:hypothetical protein